MSRFSYVGQQLLPFGNVAHKTQYAPHLPLSITQGHLNRTLIMQLTINDRRFRGHKDGLAAVDYVKIVLPEAADTFVRVAFDDLFWKAQLQIILANKISRI